jgi:hypothetical protein
MKMRSAGAELLHAEGRTDMMKLTVIFHNFAKALKRKWDRDGTVG